MFTRRGARIFICYRRGDVPQTSRAIYERLRRVYDAVFLDTSGVAPGDEWPVTLREELLRATHLLVVIGDSWDTNRLANASDWVRKEISTALEHGKLVVPVLIDHAPLPDQEQLPGDIAKFIDCQAHRVRTGEFEAGIRELIREIPRPMRITRRLALASGVMFVGGVSVYAVIDHRQREEEARLAKLIGSEIQSNLSVIVELAANLKTFSNATQTVGSMMRHERFPLTSGLFPQTNREPEVDENPDLYNERYDWYLRNRETLRSELPRHVLLCKAIVRTIDRTTNPLRSLADDAGTRYVISRDTWTANLPALEQVESVDFSNVGGTYAEMDNLRTIYGRIVAYSISYLDSIREFCGTSEPERARLGAALAAERLVVRLDHDFAQRLKKLSNVVERQLRQLGVSLPPDQPQPALDGGSKTSSVGSVD